jgi:hypothetical protein
VVVLAACGDDDSGGGGGGGIADAPADTAVDGFAARSCEPTDLCTTGPLCGVTCCDYGQHCVNGECRCGDHPACLVGDYCLSGGAILPAAGCGILCCGPVSGIGCPI